eukprot:Hpha_TRINITY_DN554_c0_g1::TRINITY_DN554_c0_g1_i1::g.171695::m.171695
MLIWLSSAGQLRVTSSVSHPTTRLVFPSVPRSGADIGVASGAGVPEGSEGQRTQPKDPLVRLVQYHRVVLPSGELCESHTDPSIADAAHCLAGLVDQSASAHPSVNPVLGVGARVPEPSTTAAKASEAEETCTTPPDSIAAHCEASPPEAVLPHATPPPPSVTAKKAESVAEIEVARKPLVLPGASEGGVVPPAVVSPQDTTEPSLSRAVNAVRVAAMCRTAGAEGRARPTAMVEGAVPPVAVLPQQDTLPKAVRAQKDAELPTTRVTSPAIAGVLPPVVGSPHATTLPSLRTAAKAVSVLAMLCTPLRLA